MSSGIFLKTRERILLDFSNLKDDYSLGFKKCLKNENTNSCVDQVINRYKNRKVPTQEQLMNSIKLCEAKQKKFENDIRNYETICLNKKVDETVIGWIPFVFFENKEDGYSHPAENSQLHNHFTYFRELTFDYFYDEKFKEKISDSFSIAKKLLSEVVTDLVPDESKKNIIVEHLISPAELYERHKWLSVNDILSANADPEVLKVNYWPSITSLDSISEIEMINVLAHELSHLIDPDTLYNFYDSGSALLLEKEHRFEPLASADDYIIPNFLGNFEKKYNLITDYSDEKSSRLSYPEYVRASQLREAVPDYFAAHVIKRYLSNMSENESKLALKKLMGTTICNGTLSDEHDHHEFSIHPSDETRAQILHDVLAE